MRRSIFLIYNFLLFACLFSVLISGDEYVHPDNIIALTPTDFDATLSSEPVALVEFYAPWCGYCKKLAPVLGEAAKLLQAHSIKVFSVNCDAHGDFCEGKQIGGYPTLQVFTNGNFLKEAAERTAEDLAAALKRLSGPAVSEIDDSNAKAFFNQELVVVGYFPEASGELYELFTQIAQTERAKFAFGRVVGNNALNLLKVPLNASKPAVLVIQGSDVVEFKDEPSHAALHRFLVIHRVPLLGLIKNHEDYEKCIDAALPIGFYFLASASDMETQRPLLLDIAKKFRDRVSMVFIDASVHDAHASSVGLKNPTFPAFSIHDTIKNKKYPMNQMLSCTPEKVEEHIANFLKGDAAPQYNSEPVPTEQTEPVWTVVHNNFENVVLDKSKDVLVEFYAPWCGACKQLAPIYDQLGAAFKDQRDKVLITKMKVDENDMPASIDLEIRSIPTIYLFTAKDNTMVKFEGAKTLADMSSFIVSNAHNDVKEGQLPSKEHEHEEL